MRILYVEDNEVNRALVERVMRARQCSVVFHDEGEGALDVLAKDSAIDLILLDIELAGSMTGLDVIHTMRARNDHRPVVAVTAYAMMGDRERILEAGCDQYLPKPLVVTDLLNMIDHYQAEFAEKAAPKQAVEPPAVTKPQPAPEPAAEAAKVSVETPAAEAKATEAKADEVKADETKTHETKTDDARADTEVKTAAPAEAMTASESAGTADSQPSEANPARSPAVEAAPSPATAASVQQAGQEQPVEDKKNL
jgi:two-component system cell cycle response regulator DivK